MMREKFNARLHQKDLIELEENINKSDNYLNEDNYFETKYFMLDIFY